MQTEIASIEQTKDVAPISNKASDEAHEPLTLFDIFRFMIFWPPFALLVLVPVTALGALIVDAVSLALSGKTIVPPALYNVVQLMGLLLKLL